MLDGRPNVLVMILEFLTESSTFHTIIMLLLGTRLVVHLSRPVSEVSSVHLVGKREAERLLVMLDGYACSTCCSL
jgi:hypothetical protein